MNGIFGLGAAALAEVLVSIITSLLSRFGGGSADAFAGFQGEEPMAVTYLAPDVEPL